MGIRLLSFLQWSFVPDTHLWLSVVMCLIPLLPRGLPLAFRTSRSWTSQSHCITQWKRLVFPFLSRNANTPSQLNHADPVVTSTAGLECCNISHSVDITLANKFPSLVISSQREGSIGCERHSDYSLLIWIASPKSTLSLTCKGKTSPTMHLISHLSNTLPITFGLVFW